MYNMLQSPIIYNSIARLINKPPPPLFLICRQNFNAGFIKPTLKEFSYILLNQMLFIDAIKHNVEKIFFTSLFKGGDKIKPFFFVLGFLAATKNFIQNKREKNVNNKRN